MSDIPFRAEIIKRIVSALKTISPDLGFTFDLGDTTDSSGNTVSRVRAGDTTISYDAPCPLVVINESLENDDSVYEDLTGTISRSIFMLLVQGDVEPATDGFSTLPAYHLLADVRRRLSAELLRMDPNTDDSPDPLGLGRGATSSGLLTTTGNCIESVSMSRGIVRGAELKSPDGVSPKAHFWFRLSIQIIENAANPYSET